MSNSLFSKAHGALTALLVVLTGWGMLAPTARAETIRLGWQEPWATQGQLVMGLMHTTIPEQFGVELDYKGFAYGGPLNQAALGGEVDVLLTADQPALVLMDRSKGDWRVVARMMYNRVCLYVPPASPIQALGDLKGKTLMGPIGAAAERVALDALQAEGVILTPGSLDMEKQAALIKGSSGGPKWGEVDALFGFDPLPAVFETEGTARALYCGKVVSLVMAHKDMIEKRKAELEAFLGAFATSWGYYAAHPEEVNGLFSKESHLDVSDKVLDLAASVEPNRSAASPKDQRLTLSDADLATMDTALDFLKGKGIVKGELAFRDMIDLAPLDAALKTWDIAAETAKAKSTVGATK